MDQEVATLGKRSEIKMSKAHQNTVTHLQEIKDLVVAVYKSQQKMWRAIESMSNELQELVQGGVGTEVERMQIHY